MGKRHNTDPYYNTDEYYDAYYGGEGPPRKRGGGRALLVLILLVGGVYVVHTGAAYLANYVPVAAVGDLNIGSWAVGGVLLVFFAWCFGSGGSKGGRR